MKGKLFLILLSILVTTSLAQADDPAPATASEAPSFLVAPRRLAPAGEYVTDAKGDVYRLSEKPNGGIDTTKVHDASAVTGSQASVDPSGRAPRCPVKPVYCNVPQYDANGKVYWIKVICGWVSDGPCR